MAKNTYNEHRPSQQQSAQTNLQQAETYQEKERRRTERTPRGSASSAQPSTPGPKQRPLQADEHLGYFWRPLTLWQQRPYVSLGGGEVFVSSFNYLYFDVGSLDHYIVLLVKYRRAMTSICTRLLKPALKRRSSERLTH